MVDLPSSIKQGEQARLFPVVSDGSREQRLTSLFLALLTQIPELGSRLFSGYGPRFGARTRIDAFTEVVFKNQSEKVDRPDGFLEINTSQKSWSALVEAKIGRAILDQQQVERYLELARANDLDAVITISNQFVARPDHSPLIVSKRLTNKISLLHWSWMSILTHCKVLQLNEAVDDKEQSFLLAEFIRHLEHPSIGVEQFSQMNKGWKDLVSAIANGETLRKTSPEIEASVGACFEEERDLGLLLSRTVGEHVALVIERKLKNDPKERLKVECQRFADNQKLISTFRVPDTADDITVEADATRKSIAVSMMLKAPQDKKSTKARVNWLLRMLKEDHPNLLIRAHWPGRMPPSQASLASVREEPSGIDAGNGSAPHSFQVCLIEDLGRRFAGSKTFIEDLERVVPEFYSVAGQHLRAWQAPPPKPVKTEPDIESGQVMSVD